jgi:hypothetical protein
MGTAANGWISLASKMIAQNGRTSPITFTRQVVGSYNPDMLTSPEGTPSTYSVVGAPLDFKLREIDQVTVITGQKMLWVPGVDVSGTAISPQVGDTVDLGIVYNVLEVTSFETESVNCAFLLKIGV